jgi:DNA uptake protein ComE-like DNA-binding protein
MKELFTHNRGERLGITALICILVAVIVFPSFLSERKFPQPDMEQLKREVDAFHAELAKARIAQDTVPTTSRTSGGSKVSTDSQASSASKTKSSKEQTLFAFDPNTCDSASFCQLGFSPKQTSVILKYRAKGGRFRVKEDFKKMFVVSDEMYAKLESYIRITQAEAPKIELNAADTSALKRLRGIGSYYARRIVEYRSRLGGFYDIAQLKEIKGIDSERFAQFSEQAEVNSRLIRKININSADEEQLRSHPYITSGEAKAIIKYRDKKGKIGSVQELIDEKALSPESAERLTHYLEFN